MKLQHECETLLQRFGVPALGLARIDVTGAESLGCLGERKRRSGVAVTEQDLWHVGSCGKSMTATLMARLVERGQLEWDAPLTPVFAAQGFDVHPDFADLTLRHLLTHRSGMATDASPSELEASYYSTESPPQQRAALAQEALMTAATQRPGEASHYSNLAYTVAGVLAEMVSGLAWEVLMRREVFSPLGLSSAGFGAPGKGARDELAQPWGHQAGRWGFSPVPPNELADNPPLIAPAGTVHLSLPDLARYVAFHLSSGATVPGYLSAETVDFLHAPLPGEEEAFGWYLLPADVSGVGKTMLWHDGSNNYWYAAIIMVPDDRRGMAFVCNAYRDPLVDPQAGVVASLADFYSKWVGPMA
jgi:CubicO group peptidase (beta-lactamase class C family)